jgi:hypothetical protein
MSTSYGPNRLPKLQTALSCILLVGSMNYAHADVAEDTDQTHAHSLDPVLVTAQALHGPQSAPSQGSLVATGRGLYSE